MTKPEHSSAQKHDAVGLNGLKPAELLLLGLADIPPITPWMPATTDDLKDSIPGHKVIALLGRGGMGAVYLGVQKDLNRQVAIKVLPEESNDEPEFAERFRREARILATLHHPNIVAIYDSGLTREGHMYYVMEYVRGTNLQDRLHQGKIDLATLFDILHQISEGLQHAHENGVVHRDLKPSNILLGPSGQIKVADFGLATHNASHHDKLTRTGTTLGTADYAAPEQLTPGLKPDARSDVYSLGVIAYELLTQTLPRGAFDPPSKFDPAFWRFDDVILQALRRTPSDRFTSVTEFHAALTSAFDLSLSTAAEDTLLGTASASVLEDLYQTTILHIPPGLRIAIEEELLSRSGFRESRPLEDFLVHAGSTIHDLTSLTNAHILRIQERAGITRIEISHDRLVGPIQTSRDSRRAQLAATTTASQVREIHSKLRRRNTLAACMALLAMVAILSAVFAWKKHREADQSTKQARSNRQEAEGLIAFLLSRMQYISQTLGRVDLAEHLLQHVDQYYATAQSTPDDVPFLRNKADFFRLKGNVRLDAGMPSQARVAYTNATHLRELILLLEKSDVRVVLDLAEDLQHLEDSLRALGDTNGVDTAIASKSQVALQALKRDPTNHAAWDYLLRGQIADAVKRADLGNPHLGIQELEGLVSEANRRSTKNPGSWPEKFSVLRAYRAQASLLEKFGRLDAALSSALVCERIAKEKTEHEPGNLIYEAILARARLVSGRILATLNRHQEALPKLSYTVETMERMRAGSPAKPSIKLELNQAYTQLAQTLENLSREAERQAILHKQSKL